MNRGEPVRAFPLFVVEVVRCWLHSETGSLVGTAQGADCCQLAGHFNIYCIHSVL